MPCSYQVDWLRIRFTTHSIYDHLQAQFLLTAPGSLATICSAAFREQFGPPGSCRGPFQHAGCTRSQTKLPTFCSLCHLGQDPVNWCRIYYFCKNVVTGLDWESTHLQPHWIWFEWYWFKVGIKMKQHDRNDIKIVIAPLDFFSLALHCCAGGQ